ncbi:hypothetical protein ACL03H_04395 [Saccharopolyspora sp. MS10]|uniref:hypothetical protein n=1 Tax=Saccharopolyspora sp. MS10 TaxID=3385973 RepID=UPI0039A1AE87
MRLRTRLLLATAAAALVALPTAVPGAAATGEVLVFSTEFERVTTYDSPSGCTKAPPTAHVLINNTDAPVRIYGDPVCLTPSLTVAPGYGAHIPPGTGSFSA